MIPNWLLLGCAIMVGLLIITNLRICIGLLSLPKLRDVTPSLKEWPKLSLILAACNEEATLEEAVNTLLQVDYPSLELILVNDRSDDRTGACIDKLAKQDKRIIPVHITELPEGWLGKVHALHCGTKRATGEYFVYTDADIHFSPGMLKRAATLCETKELGHLTVMPRMYGNTFLLDGLIAVFGSGFLTFLDAKAIGDPDSNAFAGVGAFGMVRRTSFEQTEGWEWLRMELLDDIGLALMMVQEGQARSMLATGGDQLSVMWYEDVPTAIKGFEKNAFSGIAHFRVDAAIGFFILQAAMPLCFALLLLNPFTWYGWLGIGAWLSFVPLCSAFHSRLGHTWAAPLLIPIMAPVMGYSIIRSAWYTLRQDGISWRGTFYPLEALKRGKRINLFSSPKRKS